MSAELQRLNISGITTSQAGRRAVDLTPTPLPGIAPELLLSRLSFSHFLELLSLTDPLQRAFYEVQAVNNSWSVRELKRALNTLLYERTGLSTDKAAVLAGHTGAQPLGVADVVKNPYVLEFLGLEVRLILCAQKNDTLVRYATTGLSEQLFVSKYRVNLPLKAELQQLVR